MKRRNLLKALSALPVIALIGGDKCNCSPSEIIVHRNECPCGKYISPRELGNMLERDEYNSVTKLHLTNSDVLWSGEKCLFGLVNANMHDCTVISNMFRTS